MRTSLLYVSANAYTLRKEIMTDAAVDIIERLCARIRKSGTIKHISVIRKS